MMNRCYCLLLALTILLLLLVAAADHRKVFVPSNDPAHNWALQDYLCGEGGQSLHNGDTLILNSFCLHMITPGPFCLLQNLLSINIRSDATNTTAHIVCIHQEHTISTPTRGFGFLGIKSLSVKDLSFHHCGGKFIAMSTIQWNSSHFYFPSNQAAVLYFNRCSLVNLTNIQIDAGYYGYALLMVNNMGEVNVFNVSITDSIVSKKGAADHATPSPGSGMLILATESSFKLCIKQSQIVNNINSSPHPHLLQFFDQFIDIADHKNRVPIISAGGLTIIFSPFPGNLFSRTQLSITGSNIKGNQGSSAGGVLILYWDINSIAHIPGYVLSVKFDHVLFQNNSLLNPGNGAGMAMYILSSSLSTSQSNPTQNFLEISNSSFFDHHHNSNTKYGGALYIAVFANSQITASINIENSFFALNAARAAGSAVYVESIELTLPNARKSDANVFFVMKDVKVIGNGKHVKAVPYYGDVAAIDFRRISRVRVIGTRNGSSSCTSNSGSCLSVTATTIELQGIIIFMYNLGVVGGAIQLHYAAVLIFATPAQVYFENNNAFLYGGAIYAVSESGDKAVCPMQIQHRGNSSAITFSNNYAHIGGHSLYIDHWNNCPSGMKKHFMLPREYEYCNRDFDSTCDEVSSPATTLQLCGQDIFHSLPTYPGSTLNINVTALNAMNQTVNCPVSAQLNFKKGCTDNGRNFCPLLMMPEQQIQQVKNCTTLSYKILSQRPLLATMGFAVLGNLPSFYINISIQDCPLGFYLSHSSRQCKCETYLEKINATCSLSTTSITIPANTWLGYVEFSNSSGYALAFPTENHWKHKTTTVVNMTELDFFCQGSTTGVLCGECKKGYSRVFGSNYCFKCSSNLWLLLIAVYIVIGVIVIICLLCLRITVSSGLVSGIIFYANMTEILRHSVLAIDYKHWYVDYVMAFLNLNTAPTPTCFYVGMTATAKMALHFAFPAYLVLIVIALLVISRYSITLSNLTAHSSVQVLATLLYLTYARFMLNVIDILTPVTVIVPQRSFSVWLKDGSVRYWDTYGHKLLAVLAILVIAGYLFPFLVFTTLASVGLRMRWIRKIRPFVDAYHGQYRDKWGFWFGARLLVVVCTCISFSLLRGHDLMLMLLFNTVLLVSFTFAQLQFKPFRSQWVNLGDSLIMLNLIVLQLVTVFSLMGRVGFVEGVAMFLTGVIVLLVIATIGYHCLLIAMRIQCVRTFYRSCNRSWFSATRCLDRMMRVTVVQAEGSSEPELREPLLDTIN